ncbi:hypothetical protein [Nostoc sp.]
MSQQQKRSLPRHRLSHWGSITISATFPLRIFQQTGANASITVT